jgi:glycosyltransferase involved in cell wall biosynthesis
MERRKIMNICMTHYAFYPTTGGVETHLLDLCAELARQGNRVHALVGAMPGEPEESEVEGVHVHRVDWMNPLTMRERKEAAGVPVDENWPLMQEEIKARYRRFVGRHGIHLVHAHNFHHFLPEYGLALTELRREDGIPTFLTIHEMWGEFLCHDLLNRTEWDKIVTVGQYVYGDMVAQVERCDNVEVVLHGVNTDMFHPDLDGADLKRALGLEGRRVILHPARLLPWKGVHTTVEAFRKIADRFPDVSLVITDTHEILDWADELQGYRERIFSLVEENGLRERVVMRSFDFFRELPQAYGMADIVVYPTSGEEPFGLVPLEAMASARPILVTRSGGLIESVVDGVTGFMIPKEDAGLLADRLTALLSRPELARRMGQAGRRHVEQHFTRQRMALEVLALYRTALDGELTLVGRRSSRALQNLVS